MVQVRRMGRDATLIWSEFRALQVEGETEDKASIFAEAILLPFELPFEAPKYIERQLPDFQGPSEAQELLVYRSTNRNVTSRIRYYGICQTSK